MSCFRNTDTELGTRLTISQATLELPPSKQAPIVREVWMSDYTDPFWLTFIGSFGTERLGIPDDYLLSGDSKTLTLSAVQNAALPQLHGPGDSEPCFHMLLVFKALDDAILGDHPRDGGALVATFVANGGGPKFVAIDVSKSGPAPFAPASLTGCCAYLVSVQKITSTSKDERAKLSALSSFETMVENMFPPESMAPLNGESLLRVLPEYLGPLAITS